MKSQCTDSVFIRSGSKPSEMSRTILIVIEVQLTLTAIIMLAVFVILHADCLYDPDWPYEGDDALDCQGSCTAISLVLLPSTSSERSNSKAEGTSPDNCATLEHSSANEDQCRDAEETEQISSGEPPAETFQAKGTESSEPSSAVSCNEENVQANDTEAAIPQISIFIDAETENTNSYKTNAMLSNQRQSCSETARG